MSARHLPVPREVLGLAAQFLAQPTTDGSTVTAGRLWSLVAVLLGLAGVVVGVVTLVRAARRADTDSGRTGAAVALVAGATGALVGGLVVGAAEGGPGTGYGIVGGVVALAVGLVAVVLGGLAVVRLRRAT